MDKRYSTSQALLQRARQLIPGGHHLSGRPLLNPEVSPMYFERAQGCRVWDVDGNEYIDYLMAYGAFALGYARDAVDRAAFWQAKQGSLISLNHPLHLTFVEAILKKFSFAEQAVFLKTGSEATTAAIRIARRATGRKKIVRCGYHGWHDWCLPHESFIPAGLAEQVLEFDVKNPQTLEQLFAEHSGQIAAVILAPEMVPEAAPEAFRRVFDITSRHKAVFIMDEIKTAFRTLPGSVHQRVGVTPDLLTVSKALGNGWPVAAVLGKRAVMEAANGMHISATYHGDTASMAAALMTLEILEREHVAQHLWQMGQRLIDGLQERARHHAVPVNVFGEPLPPMPFMKFSHRSAHTNAALSNTFYSAVLAKGILLHPRHMWFISHAHREQDIDATLDACDAAFAVTRREHENALAA